MLIITVSFFIQPAGSTTLPPSATTAPPSGGTTSKHLSFVRVRTAVLIECGDGTPSHLSWNLGRTLLRLRVCACVCVSATGVNKHHLQ